MVDETTPDSNASTGNQDAQGDSDASNTEKETGFVTSKQLNAALTTRNKALEKQLATLTDKLDKLANPNKEEKEEQTKYQKMQSQLDALRKERDQEIHKGLDTNLRSTTKDQLLKLGVKPAFIKAVMAQHIDADKTIAYNEDGKMVFKGEFGDEDLVDGLKGWAKSAEAKEFISGRGLVGTGDKKRTSKEGAPIQEENEESLYKYFGIK